MRFDPIIGARAGFISLGYRGLFNKPQNTDDVPGLDPASAEHTRRASGGGGSTIKPKRIFVLLDSQTLDLKVQSVEKDSLAGRESTYEVLLEPFGIINIDFSIIPTPEEPYLTKIITSTPEEEVTKAAPVKHTLPENTRISLIPIFSNEDTIAAFAMTIRRPPKDKKRGCILISSNVENPTTLVDKLRDFTKAEFTEKGIVVTNNLNDPSSLGPEILDTIEKVAGKNIPHEGSQHEIPVLSPTPHAKPKQLGDEFIDQLKLLTVGGPPLTIEEEGLELCKGTKITILKVYNLNEGISKPPTYARLLRVEGSNPTDEGTERPISGYCILLDNSKYVTEARSKIEEDTGLSFINVPCVTFNDNVGVALINAVEATGQETQASELEGTTTKPEITFHNTNFEIWVRSMAKIHQCLSELRETCIEIEKIRKSCKLDFTLRQAMCDFAITQDSIVIPTDQTKSEDLLIYSKRLRKLFLLLLKLNSDLILKNEEDWYKELVKKYNDLRNKIQLQDSDLWAQNILPHQWKVTNSYSPNHPQGFLTSFIEYLHRTYDPNARPHATRIYSLPESYTDDTDQLSKDYETEYNLFLKNSSESVDGSESVLIKLLDSDLMLHLTESSAPCGTRPIIERFAHQKGKETCPLLEMFWLPPLEFERMLKDIEA